VRRLRERGRSITMFELEALATILGVQRRKIIEKIAFKQLLINTRDLKPPEEYINQAQGGQEILIVVAAMSCVEGGQRHYHLLTILGIRGAMCTSIPEHQTSSTAVPQDVSCM
jgi:hypothetical protein